MAAPLRVLIVEDSEADAQLLLYELARGGYAPVSERVDTPEGLQAALRSDAWDVVLSDYVMPRFNGLTALKLVHDAGYDLPFILVSGQIGEEAAVAAMKAGAHDFLMKGDLARLIQATERELRAAEERRERRRADAALRQAHEELRQAHAGLEQRVEERTRELAEAHQQLKAQNEELQDQQEELKSRHAELREMNARVQEQTAMLERLLVAEQQAKMQAEEAVRMRDEFMSVAAHELKTPVTSLRGFAQLLLRHIRGTGSVDPSRLTQVAAQIDRQTLRLTNLLNQLLDLSRIEAGKLVLAREVADVSAVVDGVVATIGHLHPSYHFVLQASAPLMALVDPLRLEQVITNLLDNAVKFSPDGSIIEVVVMPIDHHAVSVAVRDYGKGIAEENRPHVFERFYQGDDGEWRGGMGLGLFISHQIVELHGGSIAVECPPEGGTRFTVLLPTGTETTGQSLVAAQPDGVA